MQDNDNKVRQISIQKEAFHCIFEWQRIRGSYNIIGDDEKNADKVRQILINKNFLVAFRKTSAKSR